MKSRLTFFLLICCCLLFSKVNAQSNEQLGAIKAAASKQVETFLQKIPVGQEQQYGFNDRAEISNVTVGEPYCIYTLSGNSLVQISQYRLPVLVGSEYKGLITVMNANNEWKVVDFGANALAKEIQHFEGSQKCISKNCKRVILRLQDIKCDFVSIDGSTVDVKNHNFFPLKSAKDRMSSRNKKAATGTTLTLSEIIELTEKK